MLFRRLTLHRYGKFPHLSDRKDALTGGTKNLCIDKHQEHLLCVKHWFKELDDPQAAAGPKFEIVLACQLKFVQLMQQKFYNH
jgi:hypothetical protein